MTSRDAKQDFINRMNVLVGKLAELRNEPDEMFLIGLVEIEHAVKVTRGNLALRKLIDTEQWDDDEL